MKRFLPILAAGACLSLCSCGESDATKTPPPPPPVTDTKPLGDGLKVIGYALLGASVVLTLGRLLNN